jgi:hypothetical protein
VTPAAVVFADIARWCAAGLAAWDWGPARSGDARDRDLTEAPEVRGWHGRSVIARAESRQPR